MEHVYVHKYSFNRCYVTVVFITRFFELSFKIKRKFLYRGADKSLA